MGIWGAIQMKKVHLLSQATSDTYFGIDKANRKKQFRRERFCTLYAKSGTDYDALCIPVGTHLLGEQHCESRSSRDTPHRPSVVSIPGFEGRLQVPSKKGPKPSFGPFPSTLGIVRCRIRNSRLSS